jgi:DNA-directed RNA polymerase specialized sigma24 family protein
MTDAGEASGDLRPLMFSIAYRMLGSVTEAEDVVEEAFPALAHRSVGRRSLAGCLRGHCHHPAGDRCAALGPTRLDPLHCC